MGADLIGQDTIERQEQGQTGVSTVENPSMPMQGGITSSTETIITDYLDADDSDIKEIVIEDEPTSRSHSSHVRPEDETNLNISKNDIGGIPEEEDICELSQRTTVETVIGSCEVIDEDKKIHGLKNQDEDTCGALDIGEVVSKFQSSLTDTSAADAIELEKHELNKRGNAVAGEILDSVFGTEEHNVIERTHTEQERGTKVAAVKNPADNSNEEEPDSNHDVVSLVEVNGKDFIGLGSFQSYHLPIVNEEKVQTEVREGLYGPSSPLQLIEDFHKRDLTFDSPYSNEETIISTYEVKSTDIQDTLAVSQFDKPQQMLLEDPEVVKFENSGLISSCMPLVENSSKTDILLPHGSEQEKDGASTTAIGFTSEPNQEKVIVKVDFPAESNQKKIIANTDKTSQEGYLLQTPAPRRDASEETPLLQMVENMTSFSFSNEQHSKVVECIPMTSISLMQVKDDADEEYEKSPLLSPREQEGGDFTIPNHSVRNKKPLQSLMTGESIGMRSPLKEQEPFPNNSTIVSSPRSKGKQKPRSSLFARCMCCTTATN
ncbi:hypothetical protein E2562_028437 [Oryza meyeriana var. granulata]|uniref:Uncharacterized protein n=1 Tax=Oryza meyeriana var. granulata TaxID=110450 RepID=A0A6G1E379_9ORYZ|nr:hypothetical protein E2562_028437 [Oryza meyeriana var. granulata]